MGRPNVRVSIKGLGKFYRTGSCGPNSRGAMCCNKRITTFFALNLLSTLSLAPRHVRDHNYMPKTASLSPQSNYRWKGEQHEKTAK
eukprot:5369524-Amphidinium_carterae.1